MKIEILLLVLLAAGVSAKKALRSHIAPSAFAFLKTENDFGKDEATTPIRHSTLELHEPESPEVIQQNEEENHQKEVHEKLENIKAKNEEEYLEESEKIQEQIKYNNILAA